MGTWDVGIYDDDIAMDIKAEFEDAINKGLSVEEATAEILESFEEVLEDEDESPMVYLTLAALQLEKGSVQRDIQKKALEIINSGKGLDRWEAAGEDELRNRIRVLNELKGKLIK